MLSSLFSYRTLSIHADEKPDKGSKTKDPASAIRSIDVHTVPVDNVYTRFSTSPTLGLESAAVERLTRLHGKNVISPPKTQYWKKILNYIFGGFNFLMWIAFILTIVSDLLTFALSRRSRSTALPAVLQAPRRTRTRDLQPRCWHPNR